MKHNFESKTVKKELHESFGRGVLWTFRGVLWQFNDCENDKISMYIVQCTYSNNTFLNFPMMSSSCNKNEISAIFCLKFAKNVERNDQKLFM